MTKKLSETEQRLFEREQRVQKILDEQQVKAVEAESRMRARAVTVGTAFGGTTELTMRRADGEFVFAILQPVETIELIHQLSASVGCHLHLYPRKDFASWRGWKMDGQPLLQNPNQNLNLPGSTHPPFQELLDQDIAVGLPDAEKQPGLKEKTKEDISARVKRKSLQMLDNAKKLAVEKDEHNLKTAKNNAKAKKEEIKELAKIFDEQLKKRIEQ